MKNTSSLGILWETTECTNIVVALNRSLTYCSASSAFSKWHNHFGTLFVLGSDSFDGKVQGNINRGQISHSFPQSVAISQKRISIYKWSILAHRNWQVTLVFWSQISVKRNSTTTAKPKEKNEEERAWEVFMRIYEFSSGAIFSSLPKRNSPTDWLTYSYVLLIQPLQQQQPHNLREYIERLD